MLRTLIVIAAIIAFVGIAILMLAPPAQAQYYGVGYRPHCGYRWVYGYQPYREWYCSRYVAPYRRSYERGYY